MLVVVLADAAVVVVVVPLVLVFLPTWGRVVVVVVVGVEPGDACSITLWAWLIAWVIACKSEPKVAKSPLFSAVNAF